MRPRKRQRQINQIHHFHIDYNAPRFTPQDFAETIVPNFFWVLQSSQEKSKTIVMQNLGGKQGAFWSMWKW